jgi:hypothetical protein
VRIRGWSEEGQMVGGDVWIIWMEGGCGFRI